MNYRILFLASASALLFASCDRPAPPAAEPANEVSNTAAAAPAEKPELTVAVPKPCEDPRAVKYGDRVTVLLTKDSPGQPLSWDASGTELKLKANQGEEKSVVIRAAIPHYPGADGACLTSPSYLRLQQNHDVPASGLWLIAAPDVVNSRDVLIGNYPPPDGNSVFYIEKVASAPGNSPGPIIRKNDQFQIRGTPRDWWLLAPAGATAGTKVALDQDQAKGSHWKIPH